MFKAAFFCRRLWKSLFVIRSAWCDANFMIQAGQLVDQKKWRG